MRKTKRDKRVQTQGLVASKQPRHLPPPESALWPEYCRGKLWDWRIARFFVGRCQLCAYSCPASARRRSLDKLRNLPTFLLCTNHPDSPGELREVLPTEMCRNFKAKCWRRPQAKRVQNVPCPTVRTIGRGVRRIDVGQGLFATVDARDYKKLSTYKWYACRHGPTVYAMCRKNGRAMYMHRMILRPRKGYIVDHIDGNGLNKLGEVLAIL